MKKPLDGHAGVCVTLRDAVTLTHAVTSATITVTSFAFTMMPCGMRIMRMPGRGAEVCLS